MPIYVVVASVGWPNVVAVCDNEGTAEKIAANFDDGVVAGPYDFDDGEEYD